MFIGVLFASNRINMLNIKPGEQLKILKTISGSSLGLDLLKFVKEVP
jgi:hypothetical protein